MMKNRLFTITSFENDHGPSVMNHHKQHPKLNCMKKKIMLSVWWDWKGVVFFELFPRNQTINSDVYCHQLKTSLATRQKLLRPYCRYLANQMITSSHLLHLVSKFVNVA